MVLYTGKTRILNVLHSEQRDPCRRLPDAHHSTRQPFPLRVFHSVRATGRTRFYHALAAVCLAGSAHTGDMNLIVHILCGDTQAFVRAIDLQFGLYFHLESWTSESHADSGTAYLPAITILPTSPCPSHLQGVAVFVFLRNLKDELWSIYADQFPSWHLLPKFLAHYFFFGP